MKHTDLPWRVVNNPQINKPFCANWREIKATTPFNKHGGCQTVVGLGEYFTGAGPQSGVVISKADADLIIVAVNNHHALTKAVQLAVDFAEAKCVPGPDTITEWKSLIQITKEATQ